MNLMERMEKKTSEKPLEKTPDNKFKQSEESKNDNVIFRSEQQNLKSGKNEYAEIIDETHKEVAAMLAKIDNVSSSDVETLINDYISENHPEIGRMDKAYIVKSVQNEITGLGPLEELISDSTVSEIMVNGPNQVYVERKGKLVLSDVKFQDEEHVRRIIDRIVTPLGRRIDDSNPMVDARLKDGSRVNAIIPPLALCGSTITIRKFSDTPLTIENLMGFGSLSPEMAGFLEAGVRGKLNILVSGGTGSGKTTLLNVLSAFIPHDERIVTIEDAAELKLMQDHVVSLESRPANLEGTGAITIRDLVKNALRMRPDRIVVGEVRGGETLDMLQAMNTGHDGSLTTAHANSARDALARIETMVMMSGMELPVTAIRQQCAGALDLIVQQARLRDGSRKITSICEITGMEGDIITTQEIFRYVVDGLDSNNKFTGHFESTGVVPQCCDKVKSNGVEINNSWFFRE
ncbi:CpaF family protein [Eubacterium ventriosum]|mgnify:FL=1|jgi:pilus assembly protein CpaF|uniref:CpaF family protein n=1 Tax=Eubacterium ventriosum TaxID=39496 RepID=UPI000E526296|nr:CpaF family protein [Eubacterium ventriosum]RHD18424.1 CpaF family protein [Eubacterium ventriosum]